MSVVVIDTSVLVAAMVESEAFHPECRQLLRAGSCSIYSHCIAEAFATLTGGSKGFRVDADTVQGALENYLVPALNVITLPPGAVLAAMRECKSRGVRGGVIYDFRHLVAARKAKAPRLYTLNVSHLQAFHRAGDPEIVHP